MKKLIALTLIMAIMLMMGISAFAVETLTIGTITNPLVNGVYTFTVPFTASAGVEQVTLLATRGGATAPTTIADTTIVAIDQVALSAGQFVFAVDATKFDAVTYPKIYIKIGGTAIDTAVSNDPILLVEATTTFTVIGSVSQTSTIGDPTEEAKVAVTATLKDGSDATIATTVADAATGAYIFNDVAAGTYTVSFDRTGALKKNPIGVDTANAVNGTVNLGTTTLYTGDLSLDGYIEMIDAYLVLPFIDTYPGDGIYDPLYDMNLDGYVEMIDAYLVLPQIDFYDYID